MKKSEAYIHPSHKKTPSPETRDAIIRYSIRIAAMSGLDYTYEQMEEALDKVLSEPLIDLLEEYDDREFTKQHE